MGHSLICPRGHHWDFSAETLDANIPMEVVCPVCGVQYSMPPLSKTNPEKSSPSDDQAATVISESWPQKAGVPEVPGYEVLCLLGQGGMGKVFKARHVRLDRFVALKMISAGGEATGRQLERFRAEAQALARLHHPHIVQIYEVNEYEGKPYLSLELVSGGNLDDKLRGTPQPPLQAARLIEILARAIHVAHENGIAHRDLKPANILLTENGAPKITDFGLAKRIEPENNQTQTAAIVGTPMYMAPEQTSANARAIGPLTDIYALGVMLYEMLAGRTPFRGATALETMDLIRKADLVPPRRLQPRVPRDLETICLKCLEKTPSKRYATALALAEDLNRFLIHEPIEARRAGPAERLFKWVRRHPAGATVVGVIVLALLAVGALGLWSNRQLRLAAERAEAKADLARTVVDDMYTKVAEEWLAEEPSKDPLRQEFLEKALKFYQELVQENRVDPGIRREVAVAHFRLGQIHRILNERRAAEKGYGAAIALQHALCEQFPENAQYVRDLAESYNWRGELLREGGDSPANAVENYRRARDLQHDLASRFPREPIYRKDLARSHYNLALAQMSLNQLSSADANFAEAIRLLETLHVEHPDVRDYAQELARCCINRGTLHKKNQKLDRAADDYRQAIRLLRPFCQVTAGIVPSSCRSDLAVAQQNLGNALWSLKRPADALRELDEAEKVFQRLVSDFPTRPEYKKKLANTYNSLASVQASTKAYSEAEKDWRQAYSVLEQLARDYPEVSEYEKHLGITVGNLGWLHSEQGARLKARQHFERAILHLQKALKPNPSNPDCLLALRNQYQSLAETLVQMKDTVAAAEAAKSLAGVFQDRPQDHYYAACFVARCVPLVDVKQQQNYVDQATALLEQAGRLGPVQRLSNEPSIFGPALAYPALKKALDDLTGKTSR